MNKDARENIQEALDMSIETTTLLTVQNKCKIAKELLAAEPDEPTVDDAKIIISLTDELMYIAGIVEKGTGFVDTNRPVPEQILAYVKKLESAIKQPTVSKSVEELSGNVDAISHYPGRWSERKKALVSEIQQFLDAQLAERDNRIEEQEKKISETLLELAEARILLAKVLEAIERGTP